MEDNKEILPRILRDNWRGTDDIISKEQEEKDLKRYRSLRETIKYLDQGDQ